MVVVLMARFNYFHNFFPSLQLIWVCLVIGVIVIIKEPSISL